MQLYTDRLRIIPLEPEHFKLLLERTDRMEGALGLSFSGHALDKHTQEAMEGLYQLALEHTNSWEWYTNWQIVLRTENIAIGSLCFMGEPDENGTVEVGYGTNEEYRNLGYMTEAVKAVCEWALNRTYVTSVRAESDKINEASRRVLEKCGMTLFMENEESMFWHLSKQARHALV